MKYHWILVLAAALIFYACNQTEYQYPDGIPEPESLANSRGCGNFMVYQLLNDTTAVSVAVNGRKLNLTEKRKNFELNPDQPDITVKFHKAGTSPDSVYFNFCDDAVYLNQGKVRSYKALSGELSYSVSEDDPIQDPEWQSFYQVTVQLKNVLFENKSGSGEIFYEEVTFWNVDVGWLPG